MITKHILISCVLMAVSSQGDIVRYQYMSGSQNPPCDCLALARLYLPPLMFDTQFLVARLRGFGKEACKVQIGTFETPLTPPKKSDSERDFIIFRVLINVQCYTLLLV